MRFQTSETVTAHDAESVLRALEICLKSVSSEVERYGHQITLHGLGPSPRTVNYHDTTVLCVKAEDDKTVIDVDVSFLASALLGDMPQDAVVRSKLERVFEEMKAQLEMDGRRAAAKVRVEEPVEVVAEPVVASAVVEAEPVVAMSAVDEDVRADEAVVAEVVSSTESVEEVAPEVSSEVPVGAIDVVPAVEETMPFVVREQEFAPAEVPIVRRTRRQGVFVAVMVTFILLVAGGFFLWHVHDKMVAPASARSARKAVANGAARPDAATSKATGVTGDARAALPRVTGVDALGEVKDPTVWLRAWAAAMRSRDAVGQASFYADPVERYLDQSNLSREGLVDAKRAAIEARKGLWTMRMDNVVVEKQTDAEVTVRLVKHTMAQVLPYEISEQSVRSRLRLRWLDGGWKIVSEQDLSTSVARGAASRTADQ